MAVKRLGALMAPLLLATGCGQEDWQAEIYPDNGRTETSYVIGHYDSFESCQVAAIGHLRVKGLAKAGSYLCGLNCKPDDRLMGRLVCETTRR